MASKLRVDSILPVDGAPTGGGGGIIQIVSSTKTDTASNSTNSTSNWTGHGLEVRITPKFSTSKIYIYGQVSVNMAANDAIMVILNKGGSVLSGAVGDAETGRTQITASEEINYDFSNTSIPFQYLDSAGSTSELVYAPGLSISNTSSYTVYMNRTVDDANNTSYGRAISVITAMEVSA